MTNTFSNMDDTIDVRDIIAKFEELETELTEAKDQQSTISEALSLDAWIEESNIEEHPYIDAIEEYLLLRGLLESLKGNRSAVLEVVLTGKESPILINIPENDNFYKIGFIGVLMSHRV